MSLFNRGDKKSGMILAGEFRPYSFSGVSSKTSKEIRLTSVEKTEEAGFRVFNRLQTDSAVDVSDNDTKKTGQIDKNNKTEEVEQNPDISMIEKEAYNKGLSEGKKEALKSERKKIEPILEALERMLTELAEIKRQLSLAAEKEIVDLALAIARKIICTEPSLNRDVLGNVVREAMSRVVEYGKVKVRLSRSDMNFLRETDYRLFDFLDNVEDIVFEEDDSVQSGGCVIETGLGEIDARLEEQFQVIEEALTLEFEKKALHSGTLKEERAL